MNMKRLLIGTAFVSLLAFKSDNTENDFIRNNYSFATQQIKNMLKETVHQKPLTFPRTIDAGGKMISTSMYDWTPGFFPGSLWYSYEFTKDKSLATAALTWTEKLEPLKDFTKHHDLGFMMYCSYGNA